MCGHFWLYCDDYKACESFSYDASLTAETNNRFPPMFVNNMMFHFIPAHHKLIAPVCPHTHSKNDLWAKLNSVVDSGSILWK